MAKKWICTVCGYVHEGDTPPEKCPQCKQPAEKFKELKEDEEVTYAAEHVIGVAKGVDPEILAGLKAHFEGECSEVGMYLAMSRHHQRDSDVYSVTSSKSSGPTPHSGHSSGGVSPSWM